MSVPQLSSLSQAPLLLRPRWAAPANVHAAFSLRGGGVSVPPWDSLNLGVHVGDDPLHVAENRRRVHATLQLPAEPLWLEQVHGVSVAEESGSVQADAMVTRRAGAVCCIQVADCLPILLAKKHGSVIGAAHAGWRGLAGGVIENTVRAMAVPAAELCAWLGPCIGPTQFEVGEEVRAAFVQQDAAAAQWFVANARGRWQCDLPALARARLHALGVTAIAGGEWCTASDATRFFSHRRDGRSGRMAALIWLT